MTQNTTFNHRYGNSDETIPIIIHTQTTRKEYEVSTDSSYESMFVAENIDDMFTEARERIDDSKARSWAVKQDDPLAIIQIGEAHYNADLKRFDVIEIDDEYSTDHDD